MKAIINEQLEKGAAALDRRHPGETAGEVFRPGPDAAAEIEDRFDRVRIRGEVSGWRGPHSSSYTRRQP